MLWFVSGYDICTRFERFSHLDTVNHPFVVEGTDCLYVHCRFIVHQCGVIKVTLPILWQLKHTSTLADASYKFLYMRVKFYLVYRRIHNRLRFLYNTLSTGIC